MSDLQEAERFDMDFGELLIKYNIQKIVLINFDNDDMGIHQMTKIQETDGVKFAVLAFSGKGEILCPCCKNKHDD